MTIERCGWVGADPLYIAYHDDEWGVPNTNSTALFEKLVLEGFQAGLSWITILRKRENFRRAFDGFDAEKIAHYDDKKVAALLEDTGIVRNRLKVAATIDNARAFLKLSEKKSLASFLWDFVDGKPVQNRYKSLSEMPAETATSKAISKALKAAGFRFVGSTTIYAMMQAVGMVNDHIITCHRHDVCAKLTPKF